MTTAAEVKRLVKPLLMRNSDLALVGRLLVLKPVHHIIRGVFFDASWDKNLFRPTWAVEPLFEPDARFSFSWGGRVYREAEGSWLFSNPGVADEVCARIEAVALPILRGVQTIDDFIKFTTEDRFPGTHLDAYPRRRVYVDIARGDLASARTRCDLIAEGRRAGRWASMAEEYDFVVRTLRPLVVSGDKTTLARMLHEWEAQAAKSEKLEGIWEPTPFPLELSGA